MKEIGIDGLIYHGPGCCMKCGSPLVVVDHEMTIMELNQDGDPISEETTFRVKAACTYCGNKHDMMRWMGGYIPYSPSSRILKIAEAQDIIKQRAELLNEESKGKNPFIE